jgi:hypothetical protein
MQTLFSSLLGAVLGMIGLEVALADDQTAEKSPAEASNVDPLGKPRGAPHETSYRVWYDGAEWHIRSTTEAKVLHKFTGTIRVKGGKVTQLGGLEASEAKGKKRDVGNLNRERDVLSFSFGTRGGIDGFDFTVDREAVQLIFSLEINGRSNPKVVYVGSQGQHPPGSTFVLPANPQGRKPRGKHKGKG